MVTEADILAQASPEGVAALAMSPYAGPPLLGGRGGALPRPMPVPAPYMAGYRGPSDLNPAPTPPVNPVAAIQSVLAPYLAAQRGEAAQRGDAAPTVRRPPRVGIEVTPDTILERIREIESTNDYLAKNKYSSASGAYQYVDGTWNNYGGYATAREAPADIQDRRMQEDIARRVMQYDGDVYRVIAAHYLPRDANDPSTWTRPARVGKHTVSPVADYVRKVIAGTPLEDQFDAYLQQYAQ